MGDKKPLLVGIGIVLVLFLLVAPLLRRVMVTMDVQDALSKKINRFPTAQAIIDLDQTLLEIPTKYFVSKDDVKAEVRFEERNMGSAGVWRYVVVKVDYGTVVKDERRIETSMTHEFYDQLEAAGVPMVRVISDEDEDEDEDEEDY